VTQDSSLGLPIQPDSGHQASSPQAHLVARIFLIVVGILLLGYMFLGRGFAHIGIGPIYIGDWVFLLGVAVAAFAMIRTGVRAPITGIVVLLVAFVALGALRTLPYIGIYGLNALRDGVLWGYAGFALIVYLLVDREVLLRALRLYGWVVPIFALWLPISWNLFAAASTDIDPSRPGSFVPLVFFKGGDMAVHVVGVIAFLVLGASAVWSGRAFLWRMLICLPLLWTAFVAGTSNRGALVTATVGIAVVAFLAPRWRSWLPLLAATLVFALALTVQSVVGQIGAPQPSGTPAATVIPSTSPHLVEPGSSSSAIPSAPVASARPGETATGSPTSAPRAGQALAISNAGFEVGPLNDGTVLGWSRRLGSAVAPDGTFSYNIVEGGAYRGARFASVRNLLKPYQATLTSSLIPFKPGDDIAVSVWVKAVTGRPVLEIYVNWFDGSGGLIASDFANVRRTDGIHAWQEVTGAVAAPPRTTQAQLLFYEAAGGATIGIDQVTARSGDFIPESVGPRGRPATLQQMIENLLSIFGSSSDSGLEGSKQFRLAWWGEIVDYTVFGKYFWTGKGFGVNLADADGFQSTVDHSLRSPHNSNMTVLARMGVPGLILWLLLQGLFGIGLLRATLAFRRAGYRHLTLIGGLVFAYWLAMMVDTSFDPYLEGPQGGIWFWTIFGLGLVVMRIAPYRRVTT
jgi:hypothetical protein